MKRARLNNTKNFCSLNDTQRKFQKLNNNLSHHDKKTREYDFFLKLIKSIAIKVSRAIIVSTRVSNVVVNTYKNKTSNFDKVKNNKKRKKNMNLVTRAIIEESRCLCCEKFDHKFKYCFDQEKEDFTYLEQRVHVMNLKKSHDHDYDEINDIFDEEKYSKNNSLSISSSSRTKN